MPPAETTSTPQAGNPSSKPALPASEYLPSAAPNPSRSWRPYVLCGAAACVLALLFANDQILLRSIREEFYSNNAYRFHRVWLIHPLRVLAEPQFYLLTTALVFAFGGSQRNSRARNAALALLLVFAANSMLKGVFGRARPDTVDHATVFTGPAGALQSSGNQGFPSGHAAASFSQAAVLAYYHPWTALPAYILAAGCSFSRVCSAKHFMSDIFAGALLGIFGARFLLRHEWGDRTWYWLRRR